MMTTAGYPKLLEEGLREVLNQTMMKTPTYYPQYMKVFTSKKNTEVDFDYAAGNPFAQVASDNSTTPYLDITNGYQTTYTHYTYKGGEEITRQMMDDDLYNVMDEAMSRLGKNAVEFLDKACASVLIHAFSTSYTSYGDGKPLCSTSHTRADGGTAQSNASSTSIPLTEANLEVGLLALQEVKDNAGGLINVGMGRVKLIIPPALRKPALIITESELRSNTAANDLNVYYSGKYNLELLVLPWSSARAGGSDTAWFLQSEEHSMKLFIRVPVEFKTEQGSGTTFDTDSLKFKGYGRCSTGWSGFLGLWGSQGTGAAYAS